MIDKHSLFARAQPLKTGRAGNLLWLLVLLVVSFGAWASWAKVQEQVRVRGEVVTSSRSQVVQAVDGGVLSTLYVHEGQTVTAGDIVAELNPARFAARAAETKAKVQSLRAIIQRLSAELSGEPLTFGPEIAADQGLVRAQKMLYARRLEEQREQAASLRHSLALAEQELRAVESLAETGDAARMEVVHALSRVVELRGKLSNTRNEYRRKTQQELTAARTELEQAQQILKGRKEALKDTYIRAPMSGTVKEIKVTTIGAVLAPGDEIMQIVPSDEPLIVESRASTADVAFLRPGLPANIKLDAYDYTIYGAIRGEVTYVSPDTIDEDLERDEEPYYRVLIRIDKIPAQAGRDPIEIIPGMAATVEIITGSHTVAQYLLKPLLQASDVALTEP